MIKKANHYFTTEVMSSKMAKMSNISRNSHYPIETLLGVT